MIECAIPQDILKYKTKFIGNFTVREVACLSVGTAVGLTCYFTLFGGLSSTTKMYASAICMVPFFLFGFLKPLGQPLEKFLAQVIFDNFVCPPIRKYEVRYPEYEKFQRTGVLDTEKEKQSADTAEIFNNKGSSEDKAFKKKQKKMPKQKSEQSKKIAKSKEYKGIR